MKILEDINIVINTYNSFDWTVTHIDRLLSGQRKLSFLTYKLGVEIGTAKATFIKAELSYKNALSNAELELSKENSNNQALILAKRDSNVIEKRTEFYNAKAIHSKMQSILNSIDSTSMSMSQLLKYLMNEKMYNSKTHGL